MDRRRFLSSLALLTTVAAAARLWHDRKEPYAGPVFLTRGPHDVWGLTSEPAATRGAFLTGQHGVIGIDPQRCGGARLQLDSRGFVLFQT